MRLLDANLDINLVLLLADFGIHAESAIARGWGHLLNGELVKVAIANGFTCLITRDRRFAQSAADEIKLHSGFSIVIVRIPQRPSDKFIAVFRDVFQSRPIIPVAGQVVEWPDS